jgi:NADP-dependent 3-hydroxy acid dehydrogenase YdfG
MGLSGKVAWITGGGSGIGLAGAVSLAGAGVHVLMSGRTQATLASALEQAQAAGSAEALALDVADRAAVAKAAEEILRRHGRIDILVNSAGTNLPRRSWQNLTPEDWDRLVGTNLSGLFFCCRAVLPAMRRQQGGLIVNLSSWVARYTTTLTGPAYNATKRAVIALTEAINAEECAHGIRATSILPAEVATPIMDSRPVPPTREERERMLQPEDLGQTLLYLASLPPRVCVNELVISPTWNRFYLPRN